MDKDCEESRTEDAAYDDDTEDEAPKDAQEAAGDKKCEQTAKDDSEGEIVVKIEPEDIDNEDDNTDVEYYEKSYHNRSKRPRTSWQQVTTERKQAKKPRLRRRKPREENYCPVCHETFDLCRELRQHLTSGTCQPSSHVDNFICTFCSASFEDVALYKDHHLSHLERSILSCLACGTNFSSQRSLDRHMLVDASVLNQVRASSQAIILPKMLCTTVVSILAESAKVKAQSDKAKAQSDKAKAQGDKVKAQGNKVKAQGDSPRKRRSTTSVEASAAKEKVIQAKKVKREDPKPVKEREGERKEDEDKESGCDESNLPSEMEQGVEDTEGSDGGQETSLLPKPFLSSSLTDAPMTPSPLVVDDSTTSHSQNSMDDAADASVASSSSSRRKSKKPVQLARGAAAAPALTGEPLILKLSIKREKEQETQLTEQSAAVLTSLTCPMCGDLQSDSQKLSLHIAEHEKLFPLFCTLCDDANFMDGCLLEAHVAAAHHDVFPSSWHSQALQCRLCGMYFRQSAALTEHLQSCRLAPSCVVCGETFQSGPQLQQHYYSHSLDERASAEFLSCGECGEVFVSTEQLRQHQNSHGTTDPFTCEECGDTFKQRKVMERHRQVHFKPQDCKCEICGVQLLTRSGYLAHLRGHKNNDSVEAEVAERLLVMLKEATQRNKALKREREKQERAQEKRGAQDPALHFLKLVDDEKPPPTPTTTTATTATVKEPTTSAAKKAPRDVDFFKNRTHSCPFCTMHFTSADNFQEHVSREHKSQAHFDECDLCQQKFYGKEYLHRHRRTHGKAAQETYPCDQCAKVFRRKFSLETHKKVHTFRKFLPCDICGEQFRFINEVEKHKYKVHRYDRIQNLFECNLCRVKFATLSHLNVHCRHTHTADDGNPFKCAKCHLAFANCTELKQHIFGSHQGGPCTGQPVKQEPQDADYSQESQEDRKHPLYNRVQTIVRDLVSTLPPPSEESRVEEQGAVKTEPEEKSLEDIGVETYNRLTRQKMSHPTMVKRFVCETCHKCFGTKSDLRTHIRTHTGETPYKCDYCDRAFKQRGHRKLHIQVAHTKEMPYTCEICHQGYPTRYRYLIHLKRHSGIKEHKCPYCNRAYYTVGKLNEHKRKNHLEEIAAEGSEKGDD